MDSSDSDSDHFESADENFSDEEKPVLKNNEVKVEAISVTKVEKQKHADDENVNRLAEETSNVSPSFPLESPSTSAVAQDKPSSKQFRKRPERIKKNPPQTEKKLISETKTPDEIIPKPDAIIQDLTDHISKNINKGISTFLQTSSLVKQTSETIVKHTSSSIAKQTSSLKDIMVSSLPKPKAFEAEEEKKEKKFVYDDDRTDPFPDSISKGEVMDDEEFLSETAPIKSSLNEMIMSLSQEFNMLQKITDKKGGSDLVENNAESMMVKETKTELFDPVKEEKKAEVLHPVKEDQKIEVVDPVKEEKETEVVDPVKEERKTKVVDPVKEEKKTEVVDPVKEERKTQVVDPVKEEKKTEVVDPVKEERKTQVVDPVKEEKKTEVVVPVKEEKKTKVVVPVKEEKKTKVVVPVKEEKKTEVVDPVKEERKTKVMDPVKEEKKPELVDPVKQERKVEVENREAADKKNDDVMTVEDGWNDFDVDFEEEEEETAEGMAESGWGEAELDVELVREGGEESKPKERKDSSEGWDDFDIDDENIESVGGKEAELEPWDSWGDEKGDGKSEWKGWDTFGKAETPGTQSWGWGVGALLNTATAVTQGLSSVLEAGLGVPDPEQLAREHRAGLEDPAQQPTGPPKEPEPFPSFGITTLVAGVTSKIVERSKVHEIGSKVITGGLGTLETIGKKTMQVLQEGDPGLKKKRALLLGGPDRPVLSQMLREAKEKAEVEDRRLEQRQAAKRCHFEMLFDDFQGLVHLEALEMLSRQCELKLEQLKVSMTAAEVQDLLGIMDEVKQLCEMDEEELETASAGMSDFAQAVTEATEPLKDVLSVQRMVEVQQRVEEWLGRSDAGSGTQARYERAISAMAELTAATAQQFHKAGELLMVRDRRKTVEEADTLLQLTSFLCAEVNKLSERFATALIGCGGNQSGCGDSDINTMVTNIYVEAGNAVSYMKQAFALLVPVIQLGAT